MKNNRKEVILNTITASAAIVDASFNNSHYLKFSVYLSKRLGLEASLLVSMMVDRGKMFSMNFQNFLIKNDGFFFYKTSSIKETTGMSYYVQQKAIAKLVEEEILIIKRNSKKEEHEILFKINSERLASLLLEGSIDTLEKNKKAGFEDISRETKMEELLDRLEALKNL